METNEIMDVCDVVGTGLKVKLASAKKEGAPYTTIIILGGTNDLAFRRNAEEIFQNLQTLHRVSQEAGCKVDLAH